MPDAAVASGAVEEIVRLKHAYFRLLDLKRFQELGELLTPGCTASYQDGDTRLDGREAVVAFLTTSLADPGIVTVHHGHHPEIQVAPDGRGDRATGTWYLQDRVIIPAHDLEIAGTAFYADEYTRVGDRWMISHTGYRRVFEEHRRHGSLALLSFRSRF